MNTTLSNPTPSGVADTDRDATAQNAFGGYAIGVLLSVTIAEHRVVTGSVVIAVALGVLLAPWLVVRAQKSGRAWATTAGSALPWVMAVAGLLTGFFGPG